MNAIEPFLDAFAAAGDRAAIVEPSGRTTTYRDLLRQVTALSQTLRLRRLGPGDRVVLQVPNGATFAVCTLGVIGLGGVAVLADPGIGDAVYEARIRAADPRLLIIHPMVEALGRITAVRRRLEDRDVIIPPVFRPSPSTKMLRLTGTWLRLLGGSPFGRGASPVAQLPAEADGALVFTGGTTSDPRGVRLSHGALDAYLDAIGRVARQISFETFLADTPQQLLYALRLGKTVHVTRGRKTERAAFALERFCDGTLDAYFGSPWIWQEMMDRAGPGTTLPSSVRAVFLGGAPVTRPFLERLRAFLHPDTQIRILYGLTEAGPVCAIDAADKLGWDPAAGDLVGAPLPGVGIRIDADDGDVGEVCVSSPSLYTGYLDKPERGDAPLRTGDLGRLVDVGGRQMLALVGRKKDMIIRSGVNLYPPSFEATVEALRGDDGAPLVRRCAMVGVWNEDRADEDVVLAVEPADRFDADAFAAAVGEALGADASPDRIMALEALPVTGRLNKVDKAAIRRLDEAR